MSNKIEEIIEPVATVEEEAEMKELVNKIFNKILEISERTALYNQTKVNTSLFIYTIILYNKNIGSILNIKAHNFIDEFMNEQLKETIKDQNKYKVDK